MPQESPRGSGRPKRVPIKEQQEPAVFVEPESFFVASDGMIPNPPRELGEDGVEKWNQIWNAIRGRSDQEQDYMLVEETCYLYDEVCLLRRALSLGKEVGGVSRTYKVGTNGSVAPHPYIAMLKSARSDYIRNLSMLGLTPVDRAKYGLVDASADNVFSEFRDSMKQLQEKNNKEEAEHATA